MTLRVARRSLAAGLRSTSSHAGLVGLSSLAGLLAVVAPTGAFAQTTQAAPAASAPATAPAPTTSATTAAAAPKAPASWFDAVTYGLQFDGGAIFNPERPQDGENFGDIYTDHANQVQLNQVLATVTRPTDPNATGYDFGFTLQALYGSDARSNHFLGQFDELITQRYQLDIVQANILVHLPWISSGGVDVKLGEFQSPMGLEVLDPSQNPFYSHSFLYNWGVTFSNTGILTTTHLNSTVDIYLGVDSGNEDTIGVHTGDQNARPAGYVGIGLNNLFNGKVTVLATAHIGPEQSLLVDPNANGDLRYYSDILTTWKVTDKLTSNTELNYIKDDYLRGNGFGFAQYFSYPLSDTWTANFRGEVWRDGTGGFIANFPDNLGYVKSTYGYPTPAIVAPPTTYGEFTIGATYKPSVPKPIKTLMVRPEIRYEHSLNDTRPFDAGRNAGSFLFGGDVILGF